jgi:hypothetical protein
MEYIFYVVVGLIGLELTVGLLITVFLRKYGVY